MINNEEPIRISLVDFNVLSTTVGKLVKGEIYLEVGISKDSLETARVGAIDGVRIFGVDICDDPCIPGINFIQGSSRDISDYWFSESDGSLISVVVLNGKQKDIDLWVSYVKPKGTIFFRNMNEDVQKFIEKNNENDKYFVYVLAR